MEGVNVQYLLLRGAGSGPAQGQRAKTKLQHENLAICVSHASIANHSSTSLIGYGVGETGEGGTIWSVFTVSHFGVVFCSWLHHGSRSCHRYLASFETNWCSIVPGELRTGPTFTTISKTGTLLPDRLVLAGLFRHKSAGVSVKTE